MIVDDAAAIAAELRKLRGEPEPSLYEECLVTAAECARCWDRGYVLTGKLPGPETWVECPVCRNPQGRRAP